MRTAMPLVTCSRMTAIAIGNFTFDLHAAVHGAGVHDHGLGLGERETFAVQAEEPGILADARNIVLRWRSCWMRRRLITSASASASSRCAGHPTAHFLKHPRYECAAAERDVGTELA